MQHRGNIRMRGSVAGMTVTESGNIANVTSDQIAESAWVGSASLLGCRSAQIAHSRQAGSARMLTVTREGPFWEAVEGRAPLPPSAVTLGWELVGVDPEEGTIEVAFTAGGAFLNPAAVVQGGFLAAMLTGRAPGARHRGPSTEYPVG